MFGVSERRACRVAGRHRSTQRKAAVTPDTLLRTAVDGTVVLTSCNNNDFTTRLPQLAEHLTGVVHGHRAVLDGEIVALDAHGRPDFTLLLRNAGTSSTRSLPSANRTTTARRTS
jgi:hypothetical protein